MATSSTRVFNPDQGDLMREAFSRIQIRGAQITGEHIIDGLRSFNLMLVEWSSRGFSEYTLDERTLTLTSGVALNPLGADVLEIFCAVLSRSGYDTPMGRLSREDYQALPNKTTTGRPDRFFVDKSEVTTSIRNAYLWPTPQNSTDQFRYWAIIRPLDSLRLNQQSGIAYEWWDAMAGGLTARLAEKYAPQSFDTKAALAERAYLLARQGQRERADLRVRVAANGFNRR